MRRLSSTLRALIALVTATALLVPMFLVPTAPAAADTSGVRQRPVDITAQDGVTLTGTLLEPPAPGVHPGVVLISPWGTPDTVYLAQSTVLARRGYVVLSYTTRGFGGSGGTVSLAGPRDVTDVSAALDWMIAHTAVDPRRIGVGGVSYGAGISLVAAGHEPRIKAVVALSGWTDLTETFYRGGTRAFGVLGSVRFFVEATGRPSAELQRVLADFFADRDRAGITAWTRIRSAATYLDRINTNHPAIYLAQAYGDTFFPPNQIVDFFNRLTGPKRLELSPGDHGTPESGGFVGQPNPLWTGAGRWLDQYVAGRATGIDREDPVVLRGRPAMPVETYPDWAHVTLRSDRYALGPVRRRDGTGDLTTGAPRADWVHTISTGVPTTADAGFVVVTNWLEALTGIPPFVWLPTVHRRYAGVWTSAPMTGTTVLRGIPHLRLATRQQHAGTVIAYLYDVDPLGFGRLIAHQPRTWRTGGTLDLRFPVIRHDVPAGHRLGLVVDTVDPLYGDRGPRGERLQFTGPSWLDVPIR
jgi:predicted acyl esterase